MSAENVELIRSGYGMLPDFEAVVRRLWDPGVVIYDPTRPDPTTSDGLYRGHEAALRYNADWEESFAEDEFEAEELIDAGDHVIARVRAVSRGRASGVQVENRRYHVYEVRDGKVVRFEVQPSREAAFEAAGHAE